MQQYLTDIYLTLKTCLLGMGVTIRHLLFEETITEFYPETRKPMPERFRGALHCNITACSGCTLCVRACPVNCITVEVEGKGKDRWVKRFDIDLTKCMWCGLCVEACPDSKRFLSMTREYEISVYKQDDMILRFGRGPRPKDPPPPATPPACGAATSEAPTKEQA